MEPMITISLKEYNLLKNEADILVNPFKNQIQAQSNIIAELKLTKLCKLIYKNDFGGLYCLSYRSLDNEYFNLKDDLLEIQKAYTIESEPELKSKITEILKERFEYFEKRIESETKQFHIIKNKWWYKLFNRG